MHADDACNAPSYSCSSSKQGQCGSGSNSASLLCLSEVYFFLSEIFPFEPKWGGRGASNIC
jgi:hypothetical protein